MMMELGETITLTVLPGAGVAFTNLDANRALAALGFKNKKPGRRTTLKSRIQQEFLQDRGIRDLDHYRKIVKDPLSVGPIHWFDPGAKLLMERNEHPKSKRIWYMVLDTAIGAKEDFIQELITEKRVTVSQTQI